MHGAVLSTVIKREKLTKSSKNTHAVSRQAASRGHLELKPNLTVCDKLLQNKSPLWCLMTSYRRLGNGIMLSFHSLPFPSSNYIPPARH